MEALASDSVAIPRTILVVTRFSRLHCTTTNRFQIDNIFQFVEAVTAGMLRKCDRSKAIAGQTLCKRRRHVIAAAFILNAASTGTTKSEPLTPSSTRREKRCHYVARKLVLAVRSESYTQRTAHKHMVTDS